MKYLGTAVGILTFSVICATFVLSMAYPYPEIVNGFWAGSAALLVLWAFLARRSILSFLTKKSTRYGVNAAFVVLLVFGILVALNVLARSYSWRKDITASSKNTLSPQTMKVLGSLTEDVKVQYFGSAVDKEKNEPLLKNFAYASPRFKYEYIDVARQPTLAKTLGVNQYETVMLSLGQAGKRQKVQGVSEEKITNGLIRLLRAKEQVLYFVSGHGERALENSDDALAYTKAKEEMEKQGYVARDLNLFSQGKIPADAAVIVIAGPTAGFFPKEIDLIKGWIEAGGRALIAVDIDPNASGLAKGSRQIADLLTPYGISVPSEMLVDPTSRAANMEPQMLLGFSATKEHPITADFVRSASAVNFIFPLTTYFQVAQSESVNVTVLAQTSPNAWAESDWKSLRGGSASMQPGQDKQGVMPLGVAVETKVEAGKKPTRLVLFGTSTFASTSLIDKVGNRDLFLNALAWLSDDEQFISIRARDEPPALKSVNDSMLNLVLLLSIVVIPFLIAVAGVVVWLRRAKL